MELLSEKWGLNNFPVEDVPVLAAGGLRTGKAGGEAEIRSHGSRDRCRPDVRLTINTAVRDGRVRKLRLKITGRARTGRTAIFAIIRALVSTARKRSLDVVNAPAGNPGCLISELRIV